MLKQQLIWGVTVALTFVLGGEVWGQDVEKRMVSPAIQLTSVKTRQSGTGFIHEYGLSRNDLARIRQLPHIRQAIPSRTIDTRASHGDRQVNIRLTGTTPPLAGMFGVRVVLGRFLSDADVTQFNNVAVIDSAAARRLFPGAKAIGKNIRINNHYFLIVGETKSPASGLDVYIPISTMRVRLGDIVIHTSTGARWGERFEISRILLRMDDPRSVRKTAETVQHLLEQFHEQGDYAIQLLP